MDELQETRPARARRAPRFSVFIGLGIIVGLIVTAAVTTSLPADPAVGMWATVAYMSLYGVTGGAVLGAIAGLIADRVSRRRATIVTVERGRVQERVPGPAAPADAPESPDAQPEAQADAPPAS